MAPPTPVQTLAQVRSIYQEQLDNPKKYKCSLKSLSQSECTFRINSSNSVQETICIPFKRVFQRCLEPYTKTINGKKVKGERWINIEITDAHTNDSIKEKYGTEIKRFLRAEVELAKWIESSTEKEESAAK